MSKDDRFAELYRDYYRKVVAFFVAKGCTTEEARDMAQEAFLRVYKGMDGFRGESSPQTWIFTIARNLLLNEIRYRRSRGGRHGALSLTDLESPDDGERPGIELAALDPSALEELENDERVRRLWSAIGELPPQQRVCIRLRLVRGFKYREIAVVTGKSIETVKSLLHEGKETLRLRLTDDLSDLDEPDEGD